MLNLLLVEFADCYVSQPAIRRVTRLRRANPCSGGINDVRVPGDPQGPAVIVRVTDNVPRGNNERAVGDAKQGSAAVAGTSISHTHDCDGSR